MNPDLVRVPGTDEWWLQQLFDAIGEKSERHDGKQTDRRAWADCLWSWFAGRPEVEGNDLRVDATREVLRMGRANFAKLAVESKMDRIELSGFRLNVDDASRQEVVDKVSRRMMRRYSSAFEDAMLYASVMGDGYLWMGEAQGDGLPLVTAERPQECVTIDDPEDQDVSLAALKVYHDKLNKADVAHMVLPARDGEYAMPARVIVLKRDQRSTSGKMLPLNSIADWEVIPERSGELPETVQDLKGIPVWHIRAPYGLGDFEPHLDLLKRINSMIVDRLWITKLQVFRQRALRDTADPTKVRDDRMPTHDPETGKKIDYQSLFEADPGSLWKLPYGYEIWESTPTDLNPIITAIRDDIKEFASSTRTPLYVFMPDAIQGSAEGAAVAREGQVFKAQTWQKRQTRVFLMAIEAMLATVGEPVGTDDELDLTWVPAERYSLSQRAEAARAGRETGVPFAGIAEDFWQASPETVARWTKFQKQQSLWGQIATAPARVSVTDGGSDVTPES